MIENNPRNVSVALQMLLEQVEAEIDFVNDVGSDGFESRDYAKVKEALERSSHLTAFRDQIAALRCEWEGLAAIAQQEEQETPGERRNLGLLSKGEFTSDPAYYLPMLQLLEEMGGGSTVADDPNHVGEIMKAALNDVGDEPLASDAPIDDGAMPRNGPETAWSKMEFALQLPSRSLADHQIGPARLKQAQRNVPIAMEGGKCIRGAVNRRPSLIAHGRPIRNHSSAGFER